MSESKKDNQLCSQQHRKSNAEFSMSGFVAEKKHAANGTQTAANCRHNEECGFRNPALVLFGFQFVQTHEKKSQHIDKRKVGHNNIPGGDDLKKLWLFLALLLLAIPVQAHEPYSVIVGIPTQAVLTYRTENTAQYAHEHGDYSITVGRFAAENAEQGEIILSEGAVCFGRTGRRFGMEERILHWYSNGNNIRADLLADGTWCYYVVFSAKSKAYDRLAAEIFSTFGLFYDEGV